MVLMILDLRFCRFLKSNCCGNDKKLKKIERKHVLDQESKIQEKEGRNWKTQIRIEYLASFF